MATSTKRLSSEQTLTLWKQYQRSGDPALRDRLVLTFAPLVKYIVYKKVREMPARCEVEDFISCGLEALIRSIDRYDPSKGATLEQYAWTRIHGAVLDELRRQDWAPRSVRRWERDIEKAADEFTTLHNRRPTTEELAEAMPEGPASSRFEKMINIRDQGQIFRVDVDTIERIDAAGDYMCIQTGDNTLILRETMKDLEKRLDPRRFQRVHRSTIVNLDLVRQVKPHTNGECFLVLDSGAQVKVSRSYRDVVARFVH